MVTRRRQRMQTSHAEPAAVGQTPFLRPGPWAMYDPDLQRLPSDLGARLLTIRSMTAEAVQAQIRAAASAVIGRIMGAVAVIPVRGLLTYQYDWLTWLMDGTSCDMIIGAFRQYLADPEVSAIVFAVNSPGGYAEGCQETFDEIFAARGKKRMVTVAAPMAASAAYWIPCAADEVVVMPTGLAGSIGCYTLHTDASQFYEAMGLNITLIQHGQFKTEGNEFQPLSDEAIAELQASVDYIGEMFEKAVAKARGVSVAEVKKNFGQGRCLRPPDAKKVGLVDRIDTLDNVIARLVGKRSSAGRTAAGVASSATTAEQIAGDAAALKADLAEGAAQIEAVSAAAKPETDDVVEPDENGECPEGYEKQDDGMCHVKPAEEEKAATEATAEAASPDVVVIGPDGRVITGDDKKAILEVLPSMDALRRDKDWLETV